MKKLQSISLLSLFCIALFAQQTFDANDNKNKKAVQTISTKDLQRAKKEVRKTAQEEKTISKELKKDEKLIKQKTKAELDALKAKVTTEKDNVKLEKDKAVNTFDVSDAKAKKLELEIKNKENKTNKGNAHGKDKGEFSGKEFGEERAKEAQLKKEVKKKELVNTLSEAETKYNFGKDKVKAAKDKLEADKAAGTISDEAYLEKAERIRKAEIALEKLKNNIAKSKMIQ